MLWEINSCLCQLDYGKTGFIIWCLLKLKFLRTYHWHRELTVLEYLGLKRLELATHQTWSVAAGFSALYEPSPFLLNMLTHPHLTGPNSTWIIWRVAENGRSISQRTTLPSKVKSEEHIYCVSDQSQLITSSLAGYRFLKPRPDGPLPPRSIVQVSGKRWVASRR